MSPDAPDRARVLAKLAATIVLAGALVAGMLLPFVGGTGLAARNSASLLDALPVELTDETPAGNTRVLAADGSLITMFYRDRKSTRLNSSHANISYAVFCLKKKK